MKKHFKRIQVNLFKDESGELYEFISLILFLIIVLGLLIPLVVELFIFNNQAQELDRLTKIAAKRACTLMPTTTRGIGGDINQGSLGVGTDVRIMQPLVNAVFRNESAHPESYFENTADGQNIQLRILDFLGNEINQQELETITDNQGNSQQVLLVGSNTDASLCPAGADAAKGWKYCLSKNGDTKAIQNLANIGLPKNEDLVARMEMFQPGRCGAGKDCNADFAGRIDRCSVCATKTRQSIFKQSVFLRTVLFLDCKGSNPITILPCTISTCATSRYVQYSGKRAYAPHYRDKVNLGQGFRALESNPNALSQPLDSGATTRPDGDLFCNMTIEHNPAGGDNVPGMFKNKLPTTSCDSGAVPAAGNLGNVANVGNIAGNLGNVANVGNIAGNLTQGLNLPGVTQAVIPNLGGALNNVGGIANQLGGQIGDLLGSAIGANLPNVQGAINNVVGQAGAVAGQAQGTINNAVAQIPGGTNILR